MKDIKEKRLVFLEETCQHYNRSNRGTRSEMGGCMYYPANPNTQGCAIGRHIADKEICRRLDTIGSIDDNRAFNLLPIELKELGKDFLIEVQQLHDWVHNWDENGLSENGLANKESIIKEFCV